MFQNISRQIMCCTSKATQHLSFKHLPFKFHFEFQQKIKQLIRIHRLIKNNIGTKKSFIK